MIEYTISKFFQHFLLSLEETDEGRTPMGTMTWVNSHFHLSSDALCYRGLQLHNKIGCFANDTKSNYSNCPFWLCKLLGERLDTLRVICDDQCQVQWNGSRGWSQQTQIKHNTIFLPKNSNCLFTHWDQVTLTLYATLFSPEKNL